MIAVAIALLLVFLNTTGQLLLKKAATGRGFRSAELWIGYSLFAVAVITSYALMRHVDLKYFIAVMNMNYVTVMLSSSYIFRERLSGPKILGTILILAGVVLFIGV